MASPDIIVPHSIGADRADRIASLVSGRLDDLDPTIRATTTLADTMTALADARVAIAGRFPAEYLEEAPGLEWLQTVSAGVDFLDLERLEKAGVVVTNASGIHAEPIAEQVLGYMLTFERRLDRAARQQTRAVWERYEGGELRGKTLGIVGVGAIGSRTAELASAFGMRVVGTKRDPESELDAVEELYGPEQLDEVLEAAEYLLVSCPLTDATRGLIGRDELLALGRDAVVMNVARGPVIDEDDLTWALQQGVIEGAALDVFEEEPLPSDSSLWGLSNVLITPHVAGSSPHTAERLADLFASNYRAFRAGDTGAMSNRVV